MQSIAPVLSLDVGWRDEQVRAARPNHTTGLEGMQQQAWPIGIAQITVAADP